MSGEKGKKFNLSILNTILLIGILSFLILSNINVSNDNSKEPVYISTGELYSGFKYQQELDSEFEKFKQKKQADLTNLKNQLSQVESQIRIGGATNEQVSNYQYQLSELQKIENKANEELIAKSQEYNELIWTKLNAFVKEYGETHNHEVIFGTRGSGNIMYAEDRLNITEEVLAFCNEKYSGK